MKIISSIMALLCAHKMCSATENRSGKNCDDASVHTASGEQDHDYSSVFNRIQTICNVLPDSEMLLDVHNGEICIRLKWNQLLKDQLLKQCGRHLSDDEKAEFCCIAGYHLQYPKSHVACYGRTGTYQIL